MRSPRSAVALVVLGVGLALSLGAEGAPGKTGRDGGTLLVVTPPPPNGFGGTGTSALDPALTPVQAGSRPSVIWYATCATLMAFPDHRAPEGLMPQPEAAAGPPAISRDGRTYVYERPAKPVRLLRDRIHLLLCVPLAELFDLASASGGGPISLGPRARSLGAGP